MPGVTLIEIAQRAWAGVAPCAGLSAAALGFLAACTAGQEPPPRILSGNETQVTIVAGLDSSPRPLAKAHCQLYGRRPVVRDAVPLGDNLVQGWATGRKGFVYTFDCL